jgi:Uma2 family endonuclease
MGKVILIVGNNTPHQRIQMFLGTLVNLFLGYKSLGRVLPAGVPMFISGSTSREPDLLVVFHDIESASRKPAGRPGGYCGRDRIPGEFKARPGRQNSWYEAAAVRRIWLFDPLRQDAVIYEWVRRALSRAFAGYAGRITSSVLPGFALDPTILWRDEHPAGPEMVALVEQMTSDAG